MTVLDETLRYVATGKPYVLTLSIPVDDIKVGDQLWISSQKVKNWGMWVKVISVKKDGRVEVVLSDFNPLD